MLSAGGLDLVPEDGGSLSSLDFSLPGSLTAVTQLSAGMLLLGDSKGGLHTLDVRSGLVRIQFSMLGLDGQGYVLLKGGHVIPWLCSGSHTILMHY